MPTLQGEVGATFGGPQAPHHPQPSPFEEAKKRTVWGNCCVGVRGALAVLVPSPPPPRPPFLPLAGRRKSAKPLGETVVWG
eukprot:4718259-Pyramimonas_sp.AAC.1